MKCKRGPRACPARTVVPRVSRPCEDCSGHQAKRGCVEPSSRGGAALRLRVCCFGREDEGRAGGKGREGRFRGYLEVKVEFSSARRYRIGVKDDHITAQIAHIVLWGGHINVKVEYISA